MTQTEMIHAHLRKGKSITPMDALRKFGCFRLAARIMELRNDGARIITVKERKNGKTFARYKLK
jgi:hypothetical protein